MLSFFKKNEEKKTINLKEIFLKLKEIYGDPSDEQKSKIDSLMECGYLPYPHFKALKEFSPAEVLYALGLKLKNEGTADFVYGENPSPLKRRSVKNSDWVKKEGHSLKLISLCSLGEDERTGTLIDWLTQLVILPTGNIKKGIFPTTIYLVPFQKREFGCAYLPTSSDLSPVLYDTNLPFTLEEQVKFFIQISQLAGHPVIYDVLPQCGRFSKVVLSKPYVARWFDIKEIIEKIEDATDKIALTLETEFLKEDVDIVKNIIKKSLHKGSCDLSEFYQNILDKFNEKLAPIKRELSETMALKSNQEKIQKKVSKVIKDINGFEPKCEKDIKSQNDIIQALIKEGLWSAPGGAWCSCGVPVFEKMSDCGGFPTFSHFDVNCKDVTVFANLDCQTPFYFAYLENGKLNKKVINFFVDYMKWFKNEYNFDGFRVDHIDHIVDPITQCNGLPISYRTPAVVLKKMNDELKCETPYFATLAEYMLWDGFLKEYHKDMNFDLLWGNDIICQYQKNPEAIVKDNCTLGNYNVSLKNKLSVLKTYNNQDGEFRAIDQYPAQLGEDGALFKWFKYKFLPGGKNANRPMLYADGDESFTNGGIERIIGNEVSLKRGKNMEFYKKFNAIEQFALSSGLLTEGEAQIMTQDDDGFVTWMVSKEPLKESLLVVANYYPPSEKVCETLANGSNEIVIKEGERTHDKLVEIPCDYKIISEFIYDGEKFIEKEIQNSANKLFFEKLEPSEFRIFKLTK